MGIAGETMTKRLSSVSYKRVSIMTLAVWVQDSQMLLRSDIGPPLQDSGKQTTTRRQFECLPAISRTLVGYYLR